ncbi:MAG TPA: TIGR02281 family clan AA aspartic protease [Allosphingosinicella sp.]|nr:TIGR02281 family clan AA aspartic protease [Allosphingosinicella sp.]
MNNGDQALSFIYFAGCLLLVGSAFLTNRLPLGQAAKMVTAWLLIFAAAFVAFALRDDFAALGSRTLAAVRGDNVIETRGAEIRIRRSGDGHFWINGEINGRPVRFLVDSGATITTLNRETAAGVGVEAGGGFGTIVETANGTTVMDRGQAERLRVGPIERSGLAVHISRDEGDGINVIGMNFLSSLSAWGVEGNTLLLKS